MNLYLDSDHNLWLIRLHSLQEPFIARVASARNVREGLGKMKAVLNAATNLHGDGQNMLNTNRAYGMDRRIEVQSSKNGYPHLSAAV